MNGASRGDGDGRGVSQHIGGLGKPAVWVEEGEADGGAVEGEGVGAEIFSVAAIGGEGAEEIVGAGFYIDRLVVEDGGNDAILTGGVGEDGG